MIQPTFRRPNIHRACLAHGAILALALRSCASALAVAQGTHVLEGPVQVAWGQQQDTALSQADAPHASVRVGTRLYVTGGTSGFGFDTSDYLTLATDLTNGAELWVARYDGPKKLHDEAHAITAAPDGQKIYVTGSSVDPNSPFNLLDFATVAYDAASGAQLWFSYYNSGLDDEPASIAVSPDGSRLYVTGTSGGAGVSGNYATVAYDAATGAQLWTRVYDGPAAGLDQARDVAVRPGGERIFVTGTSVSGASGGDYATIAYAGLDGAVLWVQRYSGPGSNFDDAQAVDASPDGNAVYVTGSAVSANATIAYNASTGAQLWTGASAGFYGGDVRASADSARVYATGGQAAHFRTVCFAAATGVKLWEKDVPGPSGGIGQALALTSSPDGSAVYSTGQWVLVIANTNYATVAYDALSGAELWFAQYDGPAGEYDVARAAAVSADGSLVYISGESRGLGTGSDFATVAYAAASGAQLVVVRHDEIGSGFDLPADVVASSDGDTVYLVGEALGGGPRRAVTSAFDATTGAPLWSSLFGPGTNVYSEGRALALSPGGAKVYIAGFRDSNYLAAAYDAPTGAELWNASYDGPAAGLDRANAIGASPDGARVYVTGYSAGSNGTADWATVAFDAASGATLWSARHGTVQEDDASALAVDPAGARVYVGGTSLGPQVGIFSNFDFVVIGYDASTGAKLWEGHADASPAPLTTPAQDVAADMCISPDGTRLFLAGRSTVTGIGYVYHTAAFDAASGALSWRTSSSPPGSPFDGKGALAVALSPDGAAVFVSGETAATGTLNGNWATFAYDAASGAELWSHVYDSGAGDVAHAIAVDRDGSKVYVGGLLGASDSGGTAADFGVAAYDRASGAQLWFARYDGPLGKTDRVQALALGTKGRNLYALGQTDADVSTYVSSDSALLCYTLPLLTGTPASLSVAAGGAQSFSLSAGSNYAGAVHLLLGSVSGTAPGIPVGSLLLPLNLDGYFTFTLLNPNKPPLTHSLGLLDGKGHSSASLSLPAGSDPALAGLQAQHAYALLQGLGVVLTSNAVSLDLGP